MSNVETLEFRKVMQQQINQKAKPLAKQYGLRQARGNKFILERDNILYILSFMFIRSYALSSVFEIIPVYVAAKGGYGDALPIKEENDMRLFPIVPTNYHGRISFPSKEEKEKVIELFDKRLAYLEKTLNYCNEINTFDDYLMQVEKNSKEIDKFSGTTMQMDVFGSYILGVHDGLQKRYDIAREKLLRVLHLGAERNEEQVITFVKDKSVDEIKNNNLIALHYKFTLMFLDAFESKSIERDEKFRETYETVCSRMRKFYGIKS